MVWVSIRAHCTPTEFFHGIYPDRQLAAFGGYQGSHLKTIEGFDGEIDWDFLAQDLQEPMPKIYDW